MGVFGGEVVQGLQVSTSSVCVRVLLTARVSLQSRLSSSTADLCVRRRKKKSDGESSVLQF